MHVREIQAHELPQLLALYQELNPEDPALEMAHAMPVWQAMCHDPNHRCLVLEHEGVLVATCVLILIPNLTRRGRPYGLIENVVTSQTVRRRGFGRLLLEKAETVARQHGCYKLMLMSGRDEDTLLFYEKAGFDRQGKTAFIKRF